MNTKPVSILLVDDDDVEAELVSRSFKKARIANAIVRARDGEEALEMLRNEVDKGSGSSWLVLLDLNMPRMNGIEFLDELRADPKIRRTIVFVLTTSDEQRDRSAAYERNVAGYIVKSTAGEEFGNLLLLLDHYWRVIEFPE